MHGADCPYCSLAEKKGELYCSRHDSDMRQLKSGVFIIRANQFEECDWHVTRLSLNFNLDGPQVYHAGSRAFTIRPGSYLLINEGQHFKTFAQSADVNRMVTIAFQVGLPSKLLQSLLESCDQALDEPFRNVSGRTEFFEQLYTCDATVHNAVTSLLHFSGEDFEIDQRLEHFLAYIVQKQLNIRKEVLSIGKCKMSTRIEVYRRLQWSMDYLQANFNQEVSVERLANEACLSTFHFKRLFTEVFRMPPYQYLINLRLQEAYSLLNKGLNVSDVCRAVGWHDPSSFTRLFKRRFAITPNQVKFRG